jgi:hypothetical protein
LSGFSSKETLPQNINAAQTEEFTNLLNALMSGNEQDLANALKASTRTQEQLSGVAAKQGQVSEQISQVDVPGANDWFDQFTQQFVPAYQAIAQQTAEAASQRPAAQERADRASSQGVTAALDQFAGGGAFSGAAARSATEAAINPQLDYLNQVDQAFGQTFGQTFNNLAGQGQGLAFQGQQQEFLNNIQKLQSQLGGLGQQGQTLGTQLQGSLGQAGIAQQQQGNLLGQLGQLSQPVYATPNYVESNAANFGTAIGGIGSLIGSFGQNNQLQDLLKQLIGGQGQQGGGF